MSIRSGQGDLVRIDVEEFAELFRELQDKDKEIANAIRRELQAEAKPLVRKMRDAVTEPKSKRSARIIETRKQKKSGAAYTVRTNTSALVAAGISFRMSTGKTPYVRFSASSAKLPADRKPMTRAFAAKKFRHPVFARTVRSKGIRGFFGKRDTVWVEQEGRPYFGAVILDDQPKLLEAIDRAMDKVAAEIGRSRIRGPR